MKISAFTFIKNGQILGYPFIQSIKSVLPIVDEFIVNIGPSDDETESLILGIKSKKIKIINSSWTHNMTDKGFVYGQQKMIAQYNCTGDWLFYVEGDEVYHEKDLEQIKDAFIRYHDNPRIEALAFKFIHFYGNSSTYINSPGWYRSEVRAIKSNIRSYAPDGLFWVVMNRNRKGRYPRAKLLPVSCYHYGWVRSEDQMNLKRMKVGHYWGNDDPGAISYLDMDQHILTRFSGKHPDVMSGWLVKTESIFQTNPTYKLSRKQRKHRLMIFIEKIFGVDLSKNHYKKI